MNLKVFFILLFILFVNACTNNEVENLDVICANEGEIPDSLDLTTGETKSENKFCCEGLKQIGSLTDVDLIDQGLCSNEQGIMGTCVACGDDKCNSQYEDLCNCPEDCEV